MDAPQILTALNERARLPVEAIHAARARREAVVPLVLDDLDAFVATGETRFGADALFFAFHLLGEWHEKAAYRPLARFLRSERERVERVLGDAITVTAHRVMAAVFDGDPEPLYEIIRDPDADEFIRSRMTEAIAILTLTGDIPRAQTAAFLRDCHETLEPRYDNFVWNGWQQSVAWLGFADLEPLVRQAFTRGSIDPSWLDLKHFLRDLRYAVAHPHAPVPPHSGEELTPFGDTIEELQDWSCFQPASADDDLDFDAEPTWTPSDLPARNPLRHVGRNDPCPCGSGKKFKKCCLGSDPAELMERANAAPTAAAAVHTLTRYDPLVPPDPQQWLGLGEHAQLQLVRDYHRRAGNHAPNAEGHAGFHVAVENQIALGDETPVKRAVQRLMSEGLDRHDAIHAVGSVLAGHMLDIVKGPKPGSGEDPHAKYYAEVESLTAEAWLRSA